MININKKEIEEIANEANDCFESARHDIDEIARALGFGANESYRAVLKESAKHDSILYDRAFMAYKTLMFEYGKKMLCEILIKKGLTNDDSHLNV